MSNSMPIDKTVWHGVFSATALEKTRKLFCYESVDGKVGIVLVTALFSSMEGVHEYQEEYPDATYRGQLGRFIKKML